MVSCSSDIQELRWGSSHMMFLPHSFRWKASVRNSFFSDLQLTPKEASEDESKTPRRVWSHSPMRDWTPMPRTMWPLCRRLLWKHKDIMHRKKKLHSLINSSLTLIAGVVTKIHLVWTLPASNKTLLLAFHTHLRLSQLNLSVWAVKSFLTVPCDGRVTKLWETEPVLKRSNADNPGCVLRSCNSWAGQWGTFSMSRWRTPLKSAVLAGWRSAQDRWASGCSKETLTAAGEPTPRGTRLTFKGSTNVISGQIFWPGSECTDPALVPLDWRFGKVLNLFLPFCHQRARLPSLSGEASASKGRGVACRGSLMSFFSHLPLYLLFNLLAGPKALSEKKKVPENFCRGEREGSRLSLRVAWESIRYGSILRGPHGLCGNQSPALVSLIFPGTTGQAVQACTALLSMSGTVPFWDKGEMPPYVWKALL